MCQGKWYIQGSFYRWTCSPWVSGFVQERELLNLSMSSSERAQNGITVVGSFGVLKDWAIIFGWFPLQDPCLLCLFSLIHFLSSYLSLNPCDGKPWQQLCHCFCGIFMQLSTWPCLWNINCILFKTKRKEKEHGALREKCFSPYSVRIRKNTDHKKLRISATFTQWWCLKKFSVILL